MACLFIDVDKNLVMWLFRAQFKKVEQQGELHRMIERHHSSIHLGGIGFCS